MRKMTELEIVRAKNVRDACICAVPVIAIAVFGNVYAALGIAAIMVALVVAHKE